MPEEYAQRVIGELIAADNERPGVLWACWLCAERGLKFGLSALTVVALDLAHRRMKKDDPAVFDLVKDPAPLELPAPVCELLARCTATIDGFGGLVLTPDSGPLLLYRSDHWECEVCTYCVPGPPNTE